MKTEVEKIIDEVAENFECFGKGSRSSRDHNNPIAVAMRYEKPVFALGVDVKAVVQFVYDMIKESDAGE